MQAEQMATWFSSSLTEVGLMTLAIGISWWIRCHFLSRSDRLPPGPRGLPWIGYLSCLRHNAFDQLQKLKDHYGDVVSFTLLGNTVVVLNSYEVLQQVATANRPKIGRYTLTTNHWLARGYGISNYDTHRALELRQALLRHLYGQEDMTNYLNEAPGPSVIRDTVQTETERLVQTLAESKGRPVEVLPLARVAVWNIMWKIVFGRPCDLSQEQIKYLLCQISTNNTENSMLQLMQLLPKKWLYVLDQLPWVEKLLGMDRLYRRYRNVNAALQAQLRCFEKQPDKSSKALICRFQNDSGLNLQRSELERLLFEVMAAGTDTSSLTLTAAFAYLSEQKEALATSDFTEHMNRIHRQATVVPLGLPHVARQDICLDQYRIPAGSLVIFNLYAIHQNQLTQVCPMNPVPFSVGSRSCPGQRLACQVIKDIIQAVDSRFSVESYCEPEVASGCPFATNRRRGLTLTPAKSRFTFHERSHISAPAAN